MFMNDEWNTGENTQTAVEEEREQDLKEEQTEREERPAAGDLSAGLDILKLYLKEVRRFKLLTREEEQALAKRIAKGDQEAWNTLIESNLRLVISVAKRYINRGMPFSDLIEEGNRGLIRAAQKFNYRLGFRFSTYASWWIKQTIERAISNQVRIVRLPVHVAESVSRYRRAERALRQKLGRDPFPEELAPVLRMSAKRVRDLAETVIEELSLDDFISSDEKDTFQEFVDDRSSRGPDEASGEHLRRKHLETWLETLPANEQQVVRRRFGLATGEPETLAMIGRDLGITRERVRQIEHIALARLRTLIRAQGLSPEDVLA